MRATNSLIRRLLPRWTADVFVEGRAIAVVIVLHCKPYVITASSRHLVASMQVPTTACSLCNTQRRARKTL